MQRPNQEDTYQIYFLFLWFYTIYYKIWNLKWIYWKFKYETDFGKWKALKRLWSNFRSKAVWRWPGPTAITARWKETCGPAWLAWPMATTSLADPCQAARGTSPSRVTALRPDAVVRPPPAVQVTRCGGAAGLSTSEDRGNHREGNLWAGLTREAVRRGGAV
jgi:hypothetical protein